jgi:hypothetical protein
MYERPLMPSAAATLALGVIATEWRERAALNTYDDHLFDRGSLAIVGNAGPQVNAGSGMSA